MVTAAKSPAASEQHWTYESLCALPDDGLRREILEGELYVVPSPNVTHQDIVARIVERLRGWIAREGLGRLFIAPLDVVMAEDVALQPDALFIRADRAGEVVKRVIEGPPDLVIEVLTESSFRHDLLRKRRLYASHGVPEYWIVDPDQQSVTVLELTGEAYKDHEPAAGEHPLPSKVLPPMPIVAADLFRD